MTDMKPRSRPGRLAPKRMTQDIEGFVLSDAPGHLLRRCGQRAEELFTATLGTDGPTRQQVALLVTVCQHPEASQAELVRKTGIDKNTLTQMIKRLTDRGLLERKRTERDARTNAISATPEAVALLKQVLPKVRQVQDQIVERIPAELRPVFQKCLRLIIGIDDEADVELRKLAAR